MNRALFITALAALLIAACGHEQKAEDPPRPVLTVTVTQGAASTRDVYSGEVRARVETDLAFRIGGKIAARMVDAGARVSKGQALARLDAEDARLGAEAARAQLASAESDLALAQAERERAADLLAKKFISQSAYDARQSAFAAAKARVDQARSQSALSANQEGYATLYADADGVIVSTSAEAGQVVSAGTPVLRLARAGEMEVVINVPEGRIGRLRQGQEVALALWADAAAIFPGRVREIAGGADPVTRTFAVRVTALKSPPGMRLGMTANVQLRGSAADDLIVIPTTALTSRQDDAAVWVVDPKSSRVQRRAVKVGQYREDGATILAGLSPGETVVAVGVHKLRPDQRVRLDRQEGDASLFAPAEEASAPFMPAAR